MHNIATVASGHQASSLSLAYAEGASRKVLPGGRERDDRGLATTAWTPAEAIGEGMGNSSSRGTVGIDLAAAGSETTSRCLASDRRNGAERRSGGERRTGAERRRFRDAAAALAELERRVAEALRDNEMQAGSDSDGWDKLIVPFG